MSIWILHLSTPPAEETMIGAQAELRLPVQETEDYTALRSEGELRQALRTVHAELPPEKLHTMASRLWQMMHVLMQEDILVIPIESSREVFFAQPRSGVYFRNGAYYLPVEFFPKHVSLGTFGKQAKELTFYGVHLVEVEQAELRGRVRTILRMKGTKFARWKWLLGIFLAINALSFAIHLWQDSLSKIVN